MIKTVKMVHTFEATCHFCPTKIQLDSTERIDFINKIKALGWHVLPKETCICPKCNERISK